MPSHPTATLALFVATMVGCTVSDLDLEGRECPCVDGWICDPESNLCMRPTGDGGSSDGGERDGGTGFDAGARDGGPAADAGGDGGDSGGLDAGWDAGADADTPPADAGPGATSCDAEHAGAIFCDGFEDSALGAWPERDVSSGASAEQSSEEVYRGAGALRVRTGSGTTSAMVLAEALPATTSGDLWVRSYYYFPSSYSIVAIEFAAIADSSFSTEVLATTTSSSSDIHTHRFPTDMRDSGSPAIPRDRWVCVEEHIHFDSTDGAVELFYDGTEVAAITGFDTITDDPLTTITAGIPWQHSEQEPATAYVDEVVADSTRIGCD